MEVEDALSEIGDHDEDDMMGDASDDDPDHLDDEKEDCEMQATECRVTLTRHDDWLHRGPFLADLPWYVYLKRVQRAQKPSIANADYSQIFFFDKHYPLSTLYCQEIRYTSCTTVPRLVGSVCPPEEEDEGEPHAAYKLMLFSRARCLGPLHCADPLNFRTLALPSDQPDDRTLAPERPRFAPSWRACRCEMQVKAGIAAAKESRSQKISVLADTTTMKEIKDRSGDTRSIAQQAFRFRHVRERPF